MAAANSTSPTLMPAGFFLAGVVVYAGDPGLPILLVPIGGALLFLGVATVALDVRRACRFAAPEARGAPRAPRGD